MAKTSKAAKLAPPSAKPLPRKPMQAVENSPAPVPTPASTLPAPAIAGVQKLFLSDIHVPLEWNSRTREAVFSEGNATESTGLAKAWTDHGTRIQGGLIESIRQKGQDTPVDVYRNPRAGKPGELPYILVTGFRRYQAIRKLAENGTAIQGDPSWSPLAPTIYAKVHETMSDADARALNMRENIARETMNVPDIAYGIAELGKSFTDLAIAQQLQKSQGYVSKLHRIVKNVPPDIIAHWRIAPVQLSEPRMATLVDLRQKENASDDAIRAAYFRMLGRKPDGEKDEAADTWLESMTAKASKMGEFFGRLAREGFDLESPDFFGCLASILGDSVVKEERVRHRQALSDVMSASFEAALTKPVHRETKAEPAPTPVPAASKPKSSKKN